MTEPETDAAIPCGQCGDGAMVLQTDGREVCAKCGAERVDQGGACHLCALLDGLLQIPPDADIEPAQAWEAGIDRGLTAGFAYGYIATKGAHGTDLCVAHKLAVDSGVAMLSQVAKAPPS